MQNEVRIKIGEIEFEAKGDAETIERERKEFLNNILPQAIDAMTRTRFIQPHNIIETTEPSLLSESTEIGDPNQKYDFSRTSLIEFLNQKNLTAQWEIALFALYYEEKAKGKEYFNSDDVKRLFAEAREKAPSNPSQIIVELDKKGFITVRSNTEMQKSYIITKTGLGFVENFEARPEMTKKVPAKNRKPKAKVESQYSSLCADDLNLKDYPEMKSFKDFKDKMMLSLYIVTKENKGEFFIVSDVLCILCDIWGEYATNKQVQGVFDRNKTWFKAEQDVENRKIVRRKLLTAGKDYAESLGK